MGELCTRDTPHNQAKAFLFLFCKKESAFFFEKKKQKTFLY